MTWLYRLTCFVYSLCCCFVIIVRFIILWSFWFHFDEISMHKNFWLDLIDSNLFVVTLVTIINQAISISIYWLIYHIINRLPVDKTSKRRTANYHPISFYASRLFYSFQDRTEDFKYRNSN